MTLRLLTAPLLAAATLMWTFALGRASFTRWTDMTWAVAALGELLLLAALLCMWVERHRGGR